MRKSILTLCIAACGFLAAPAAFGGTPYELEYNFDVASDFPDGANLPQGWAQQGSPFRRAGGEYFGTPAHSGDFYIGLSSAKFDEVVFTPTVNTAAGKPCTIEFQYILPGGGNFVYTTGLKVYACTSQSLDGAVEIGEVKAAQITSWTKFEASFTPEADGEVCFAIATQENDYHLTTNCGLVGLDSFFISGTEAVFEPKGTPYTHNFTFENDDDFVGVATLPAGWVSTGVKPYRRYTTEALAIADSPAGNHVIGNISSTTKLDNLLITPLYGMEANAGHTLQFSFLAASNLETDGYGFNIYAAPAQNLDGAVLIGTIEEDIDRPAEWITSPVFTFTPETDGKYCFIITPVNATGYSPGGQVAFDNITITGYEPVPVEPEPVEPEPVRGEPEAFEVEFNFDIDADFPDGANLPEGWTQQGEPFRRAGGDYFGTPAHSGDKYIGRSSAKFDEVVFTPLYDLVADKPCTIEFQYILPGGSSFVYTTGLKVYACTSQSLDGAVEIGEVKAAQIASWTRFEATFTPETDGEVCFAIATQENDYHLTTNCGLVGLDSFFISGTRFGEPTEEPEDPKIDLEPNEDNLADCSDLPYFENFSDATHYDGSSYLPIGWRSTGSVTWQTASLNELPAKAGDYYMITYHNTDGERDDRAYSPFFNLEAGKDYNISYWVFVQGNDYNEESILALPTLRFTVGTEQDADFHNTLGKFSQKCTEWVKQEFTFTPEISGAYCFAWMLTGDTNTGIVAIDDLQISAEGLIARVEPAFAIKGLYSIFDYTKTVTFTDHPIEMVNMTKYAQSYKWTAEGAEPSTSTEANPSFLFPTEGTYTITLEATNPRGTRSTQHSVNVQILGKDTKSDQCLSPFNSIADRLYERGETPAYDIDPYDFVTGYNHYYFEIAQRFDFANTVPVNLKQLSLYVTDRNYRGVTSYFDDQRIKPFSVVIFGAKEDGSIDTENELGRIDTTIGEALGSTGLGGISAEMRDIVFEEPIEVTGTVYVAMIFDRGMEVVPQDANLGRSFLGLQAVRHQHGQTTLYAKPIDKPEGSDATIGEWCPVDKLDAKNAGIGAHWMLWLSSYRGADGIVAVDSEGSAVFAATFTGDNLHVSGTTDGDTIEVFNLAGMLVASAKATDGATTLATSIPAGVYVIKCGDKATKAAK